MGALVAGVLVVDLLDLLDLLDLSVHLLLLVLLLLLPLLVVVGAVVGAAVDVALADLLLRRLLPLSDLADLAVVGAAVGVEEQSEPLFAPLRAWRTSPHLLRP